MFVYELDVVCFPSLVASFPFTGGVTVGLAFVDVVMRDISLVQFSDSAQLYQLETMLFRKGPKVHIFYTRLYCTGLTMWDLIRGAQSKRDT